MLPFHVVAGLVALVAGAIALFSRKGGARHRSSGMVFVYSMLFMSATGALIAALRWTPISVIAGVLTFYLVLTGLLTVRRRAPGHGAVDRVALGVALAAGVAALAYGFLAVAGTGRKDGIPAAVYFMFGAVGLLAALGDVRVLWGGPAPASRRLARHLWRMCFALYIATSSFFLGQAKLLPKPYRNFAVLSAPVVVVLVLMVYWLVRVKFTRRPLPAPAAA
jgi:uncharacterized membrane protein